MLLWSLLQVAIERLTPITVPKECRQRTTEFIQVYKIIWYSMSKNSFNINHWIYEILEHQRCHSMSASKSSETLELHLREWLYVKEEQTKRKTVILLSSYLNESKTRCFFSEKWIQQSFKIKIFISINYQFFTTKNL
jgi:hypothetical protein